MRKPVENWWAGAILVIWFAGLFAAPGVFADGETDEKWSRNWPQWRGPHMNGVAPYGDPPVRWDETTNIKWKVDLPGEGSATPIIWEDRVFILAAVRTERPTPPLPKPVDRPGGPSLTDRPNFVYRYLVLCFDRRTGDRLWERVAAEEPPHEGRQRTNTYASGSPVTDGRGLYFSFGSRGVFRYDLEGNLKWRRDLGEMVTRKGWGEASTPALFGQTLVVNWDHEGQSFIEALDAETGKTRWKTDRDEPTTWATPLIVERNGRAQVVVNGTTRVRAYDLAAGDVIWECGGQTVNNIPSPVIFDNRLAICMSGYQGKALYAIPLDSTGDVTGTDRIAWSHGRGTPYVPSPLLYDGLLYFTESNRPSLSCFEAATGRPVFERQRLPGLKSLYASPVGAAGRIYVTAREGTVLVLKHGRAVEVLATNRLDQPIDASPAVVGGQIFLRGKNRLYCIGD